MESTIGTTTVAPQDVTNRIVELARQLEVNERDNKMLEREAKNLRAARHDQEVEAKAELSAANTALMEMEKKYNKAILGAWPFDSPEYKEVQMKVSMEEFFDGMKLRIEEALELGRRHATWALVKEEMGVTSKR